MACNQYNLTKYNSINTEYSLPLDVIEIINMLSKKMGGSIEKGGRERDRRSSPFESKESNTHNPGFKQTVIEKKVGVELWMNEIRISLNKISEKNYDTHHANIISKMNDIQNTPDSRESMCKIASTIFEIASTNKFFSEIYARLYKSLLDVFPDVFTSILNSFIEGFTDKLRQIVYVDQNKNYDDFCNYNKENDKRKASAVFITNLVKTDVISLITVQGLIDETQALIDQLIQQDAKANEVDEITENMYLLLTSNPEILKHTYNSIKPRIQEIAGFKSKQFSSLSSRCIFKYMDMLDKINKL